MHSNNDTSDMLRSRVIAAERELNELKCVLGVTPRSLPRRAARFLRNDYGFISFLLVGVAVLYYSARYHVTPFHDFADPGRTTALARTYTAIGDRMMAMGKWASADTAFEEALKLDARDARTSYHAHVAHLMMLEEPTVVDAALAQLSVDAADDAIVWFAQGSICMRRGQYRQAEALFRRSIGADSAFIGARLDLGAVSLRMGDLATYHEHTAAAYRLDSGFSIAINNMAFSCELRHEFQESTRLYLRMDTLVRSARTQWLVGTSSLFYDPSIAEKYLGSCIQLLEVDDARATDRTDAWQVGYVPVEIGATLAEEDVVTVADRREQLGCALVSYAVSDALAHNFSGGDAKLARAARILAGKPHLQRILALEIESVTRLVPCDSVAAGWLLRATLHIRELE